MSQYREVKDDHQDRYMYNYWIELNEERVYRPPNEWVSDMPAYSTNIYIYL